MPPAINTVIAGIGCVVAAHVIFEVAKRLVTVPGPESFWSYAVTCLALLGWFVLAARSKKVSDAR